MGKDGKDDDCVDEVLWEQGSATSAQVDEALRSLRHANQAHGISGGDSGGSGGTDDGLEGMTPSWGGVDGNGGGSGDGNVPTKSDGKTREPDAFGYTWMPTITSAVKVITAALLLVTVAAGADIYQTYNDAIAIDLEKHITDADFELSEDKSEISGSVGFDIPEMGLFEKSIIASVHVTVLESNPTTDGDYEFEYTLGSGEHFYDFTLDDLDPVTVEKIEAGQPLDIEYSGTISVTYLGIEIPSITMDIPLTTTIVETA
jgi:hypothetical protein